MLKKNIYIYKECVYICIHPVYVCVTVYTHYIYIFYIFLYMYVYTHTHVLSSFSEKSPNLTALTFPQLGQAEQ